jgi:hypothetical protein
MRTIMIGLLFVGGVLMAQDQPAQEQNDKPAHLSENQRVALRTQSPPVKTHSKKHAYKPTKYQVTENKTTIVATRPYGQ